MENIAIESRIFDGLAQRFQQVFGAPFAMVRSRDEILQLATRNMGRVAYPFAYGRIRTIRRPGSGEDYNPRSLIYRGIEVQANAEFNKAFNMRLMPAHFDVDVVFETNQGDGPKHSVSHYSKRWLFAAECGLLKFAIMIGNYRIVITPVLNPDVPQPDREAVTETVSSYKVETSMTVRGFISETQLRGAGLTSEVDLQFGPNAQTWKFGE